MAHLHLRKSKKILMLVLALIVVISTIVASVAVFTDRVNRTTTIQVSTFNDDGYTIQRTAPDGYFTAGETVEATLKESNKKSDNITSQITMTVKWESPVPDVYPWGNTALDNATITLDGETVPYTVNSDQTITFTLPEKALTANTTDITSSLKFQIPSDLASTGKLCFNFDRIELGYASWTAYYNKAELDSLDFSVTVAWNISKKQTTAAGNPNRDIIAVLTEGAATGQYGLEVIKNGSDDNTNSGQMMDWSAKDQTPWASYTITDLSMDEGVTSVGDYAFAGETGIVSLDFPSTMTTIGTSAFDGTGLSGELVVPASIEKIESLAFGNLPNVTVITFEHTSDDDLSLPNNTSAGKETSGAFYVPTYVKTTFDFNGNSDAEKYNWVNDNRMKVGITGAELTYEDVVIGQTVDPDLVIKPDDYDDYQSIHYEVIEGGEFATVDPDTGIVTGVAQGTAPIKVTIVDANGDEITAEGTVNILGIGITSATLDYDDVVVGQTVDPDLDLLPENHGPYQSIQYEVTKGSKYASVDADTGVLTGLKQGSATVKVTIIDTNGEKVTAEGTVNVLGIGITSATLDYDDVVVGQTVDPKLTILPTNYDEYQSIKYEVVSGSTYASVDPDTGVVTGLAQGTATIKVTIVDTNGKTVTAEADVNILGIGITSATLDYDDVVVGQTVDPDLTINPTNYDNYQSIKYEVISGGTYASVDPDTGVVTGLKQGTATIKVTIVDTNGKTVTAEADVNILGIGITSATLAYEDVQVGETVNPGLTILPTNHDTYQSIKYEVISGSTYASVNQTSGVVTGLAQGTATIRVTIIDTNGKTVTAEGTVTVYLSEPILAEYQTWYTQGGTTIAKNTITSIHIVDSYNTTGKTIVSTWDASEGKVGTITAYVESDGSGNGTYKLTIAGNGYGFVYANPNSCYAFSSFPVATSVSGTNILNLSKATDTSSMFSDDYSLTSLDVSNWDMSAVTNISGMFYLCYDLTSLDVSEWDTGNVTNMTSVFTDCISLADLTGIRNWDTQKASNMARMFLGCNSLVSLDLSSKNTTLSNGKSYDSWDTGNVTNMSYMFGSSDSSHHDMESLNISTFDMRKVTNMQAMFQWCCSLQTLNVTPTQITLNGEQFHSWDVSNVEKMYITFKNCSGLKSLDLSGWDTSGIGTGENYSIDDFVEMFYGCTSLETLNVSRKEMTGINGRNYTSWDTSNAMYMESMFEGCSSLKSLDLTNWNNASATDMDGMFAGCSAMTGINLTNFTTSACESMSTMFYKCSSLASVDVSSFDTSKVVHMYNMFSYCSSLKKLDLSNFNTAEIANGRINKFAQYCTSLTEIVLGPDFMQSGICPSAGSSSGLFYVGTPYSSTNLLGTKVTGANSTMLSYNWQSDFRGYSVTVESATGGSVTTSPTASINGKTITLTPSANTNYKYLGSSVKYTENGTEKTVALDSSTLNFTMPCADVTITPSFQNLVPTLAEKQTWYTQGGTTIDKATITSINIVDSYDTTNKTIVDDWDASAATDGTVMAYVESDGTSSTYKLTLAGNGYGKIFANADSTNAFRDFTALTAVNGADILDTSNTTTMRSMFNTCESLTTLNTSNWDTGKVGDMGYMFVDCGSLKTIDVSNWNTSNVADMDSMFSYCYKLNSLDVSGWDTGNVGPMQYMFNFCESLPTVDVSNWDVSNVTDTSAMFQRCGALETLDVSKWTFSAKLTDASAMFNQCKVLKALSVENWIMDNVVYIDAMFTRCEALTTLGVDNWNVGSAKTMDLMFAYCTSLTSLNVSNWDTSSATNMEKMFLDSPSLTTLAVDNWDVSSVTNMKAMFLGCSGLTSLNVSQWQTTALQYVSGNHGEVRPDASYYWDLGMFEGCSGLSVIDISGWDMDQVTNTAHMFYGCTSLKSLTIPASLNVISPEFAYNCTSLTEIYFLHDAADTLTMPTAGEKTADDFTDANEYGVYSDGGAFYVPSYLETSFDFNGNEKAEGYDWGTDNRMLNAPMLAASNTWFTPNNSAVKKETISSVTIQDTYTPGTLVDSWPAAVDEDGDGVLDSSIMAYVEDDGLLDAEGNDAGTYKLTLVGNGSGFIYANPNSQRAFQYFEVMTTFNNAHLLDTSNVVYFGGTSIGTGMFHYCESLKTIDVSKWNTSKVESTLSMFAMCTSLESIDVSNWDTGSVTTMASMFSNCQTLKTIDVSNWDVSQVRGMNDVFSQCFTLETLDVSKWDTHSATTMSQLFRLCYAVKELDVSKWNTSACLNMKSMFSGCDTITSLDVLPKVVTAADGTTYTAWDTKLVSDMSGMFGGCNALVTLDVSKMNTSSVKTMDSMFYNCAVLPSVDVLKKTATVNGSTYTAWDTSLVTDMGWMFRGCAAMTEIDVSTFNTAIVTDMSRMFMSCSGITTVPVSGFVTGNVTDLSGMFQDCTKLTILDLSGWNTSKVTKIGYKSNFLGMFKNCTALTSLNVSGWDTSLVDDFSYTFNNCSALQTLDLTNWSTESATKATYMFTDMLRLDTVTLDSGFAFLTDITSSYLPAPSATYIPGAHGVWYNNSTWVQYTPTTLAEQHSSKATYVVTRPIPSLAEQDTWFTPTDSTVVTKESITSITIAESYSPSTVVDSWPAAVDLDGDGVNDDAIMAYVEDDGSGSTYKLTLAAKNYSFFFANSDSSDAFYFKNMTTFNNAHLLDTSDIVYMGSVYYGSGMFCGCTSLRTIDVSTWDTSNVKYMNYAFQNCKALTSLDVSNWDVSKVYNMENAFYGCQTLTTLDVSNWDTSYVSNMPYLFHQCYNLKTLDVSKWDTSNVTNMESMFSECEVLTTLDIATKEVIVNGETYTAWNVGKVRNMLQMFSHCYAVQELDVSNWDTSKVTDMRSLFRYCDTITELDVSNFVTTNVTDMSQMFEGCELVTEIDVSHFNTSKVTDMSSMFSLCYALKSITVTGFDTSLVTDMSNMFYGCKALTSLDLSSFNTSAVTKIGTDIGLYRFAYNCPKLTKIVLSENFGQSANIPSAGPAAGMFYISSDLSTSSVSTTLSGANDAMLAYGWSSDKRTVTSTASLMSFRAPDDPYSVDQDTEVDSGNTDDPYSVDQDTDGTSNITEDVSTSETPSVADSSFTLEEDNSEDTTSDGSEENQDGNSENGDNTATSEEGTVSDSTDESGSSEGTETEIPNTGDQDGNSEDDDNNSTPDEEPVSDGTDEPVTSDGSETETPSADGSDENQDDNSENSDDTIISDEDPASDSTPNPDTSEESETEDPASNAPTAYYT